MFIKKTENTTYAVHVWHCAVSHNSAQVYNIEVARRADS